MKQIDSAPKEDIEKIYSDISTKNLGRISDTKWDWNISFAGYCNNKPTRQFIEEKIKEGKKVRTGYTCTQIRGYHDRWVLVLRKKHNQLTHS